MTPAYTGNAWTAGSLIYASGTPGVPVYELAEDQIMSFVGFAKTGGTWKLSPVNSGVTYTV
jgi:hypothetical protein